MTTVKDLKKWLERFPEDTLVEFGVQETATGYESYGPVNFVSPKLEDSDNGDSWEFMDFKNNRFVKPDSEYYKKAYLQLGDSS